MKDIEELKEVNKTKNNRNKKKKIINWQELTYQERLILALALIALIILLTIIINLVKGNKETIDYKEITGETLYFEGITNKDREVYWILNDIIATFVDSYNLELDNVYTTYKEKIVYSREDFYEVLSDEYKNNLSKKDYLMLSKTMLEKFAKYGAIEKNTDFIQVVKELSTNTYSSNMYICKLKTVDTIKESYIGIQLYPSTKSYNIFYLE